MTRPASNHESEENKLALNRGPVLTSAMNGKPNRSAAIARRRRGAEAKLNLRHTDMKSANGNRRLAEAGETLDFKRRRLSQVKIASIEERINAGRALRKRLGRSLHAEFKRSLQMPDVISILKASNAGRVPSLIPLKMERMAVSAFSFFRGAAPVMAADLAPLPVSGLKVQLCGDAHVRNLGAYAAPDGHLVFDLNDFDETTIGPWEWDLKRLATSIMLAGRAAGCSEVLCGEAVRSMARRYREALGGFCRMSVLELARFEIRRMNAPRALKEVLRKAQRMTPAHMLEKLTETPTDGLPCFHDQPPLLRHVPHKTAALVIESLKGYRKTLAAGRQMIFDAYTPVDVAFKVVGTGSVGSRDYVVLLFGNGLNDPLFIQVKEALVSCYAQYLPKARRPLHQGRRVAQGQQRMQTVSDPFLGWTSIESRHYLVRQLADHKASLPPEDLNEGVLVGYSRVCGEALAKAHARTGDADMLAGYCGNSDKLDEAVAAFAHLYADQTERDYAEFLKALRAGRLSPARIQN